MANGDVEYKLSVAHLCWSDAEAEVVVSRLRAAGIEATCNSRVPHSVMPMTVDGLGEVQILVPDAEVERAKAVLAGDEDEEESAQG